LPTREILKIVALKVNEMENNLPTVILWGPIIEKVGTEKSQYNTSKILQKLGYKTVFIAYLNEYADNLGFSEVDRCSKKTTFLLLKLKKVAKARLLNFILQLLCSFKILLGLAPFHKPYILHTSLSATLPIIAARVRNIKTISSIQGLPSFVYVNENFSYWRQCEAFLRQKIWQLVYQSTVIYTISSDLQRILSNQGFENVSFIPNIVETTSKSVLVERSKSKIAIVGRISFQKNLPLLRYFIENINDVSWDIFGSATDAEGLEFLDVVCSFKNVKYHGHVHNPFEHTDAAFLMFPSLWDEAALTPIEAAKSGVKVIYSDKCFGANDFFENRYYELELGNSFFDTKQRVLELIDSNLSQPFKDIYTAELHAEAIKELFS